jgi:peptidoglycan/LPS O-acetylase OafA/YrhL
MGVIRLFLALVVAADHLQSHWITPKYGISIPRELTLGVNSGFAVTLFYAISGFLMSMVLAEKYPSTIAGTRSFYRSRFIRIFSLYWPLAIIILIVIPGAWTRFANGTIGDEITGLMILGMDWRNSFYTTDWSSTISTLEPSWTLAAELTFYLLAPFLLRSWLLTVVVLTASLGLRFYFVATLGFDPVWTYQFFPSTVAFFLLGAVAYMAAARFSWLRLPAVCLPLLACGVIALTLGREQWDNVPFWVMVLCFAASLPGIFDLTKASRAMTAPGELSYPVYLVHTPIFVLLLDVGDGPSRLEWVVQTLGKSPLAIVAVILSIIVFAAWIAHRAIERPCAQAMQGRLYFWKRATA